MVMNQLVVSRRERTIVKFSRKEEFPRTARKSLTTPGSLSQESCRQTERKAGRTGRERNYSSRTTIGKKSEFQSNKIGR
jgi:hypothetical protein